jgi:hypothetical protein
MESSPREYVSGFLRSHGPEAFSQGNSWVRIGRNVATGETVLYRSIMRRWQIFDSSGLFVAPVLEAGSMKRWKSWSGKTADVRKIADNAGMSSDGTKYQKKNQIYALIRRFFSTMRGLEWAGVIRFQEFRGKNHPIIPSRSIDSSNAREEGHRRTADAFAPTRRTERESSFAFRGWNS